MASDVTVTLTSAEAHALLSAIRAGRVGIDPNTTFADLLLDVSIKVGDAILAEAR